MSIKRTKREENKELYQKYYRKYFLYKHTKKKMHDFQGNSKIAFTL